MIIDDIEAQVRQRFHIQDDDPDFGRDVDLWEEGYVDSTGAIEMIAHLEAEYDVMIPEEMMTTTQLATVRGMAEAVEALRSGESPSAADGENSLGFDSVL